MLEPKDRVLLLEALRPPIGFRFDEGIGTTYTLDLVALLTAPLAFTWFEQKDDVDAGGTIDSLEVIESLRRHADRLTLFCHAGRIAVPQAHYPQLAFLEESIVGCLPSSGGAFHPKVWVLRFPAEEGDEIRYRMLCLSRNLSFSRAWDTMLVMDGTLEKGAVRQSLPLAEFLRALPRQAAVKPLSEQVDQRIERLAGEVERVRFEAPQNVEDFTFHPIGIDARRSDPLKALRGTKRLVVVSPFLTVTKLNELARDRQEMWLVSTTSQLEGLAERPRGQMKTYTLRERLLAEAEEQEAPAISQSQAIELSDLHAKLYVTEVGAKVHVWTGSANATSAAFGSNVEFLVELVGARKLMGIDLMMQPQKGDVRFIDLLESADDLVAKEPVSEAQKRLEQQIDELRSSLAAAALVIQVQQVEQGTFNLEVRPSLDVVVPAGVKASCWPSAVTTAGVAFSSVNAGEALAQFPAVSFQGVTAFLAFKLAASRGEITCETEFVLNVPLIGAPDGRREQVLRSLVKDRARMLRFLWLLLADEVADVPVDFGPTKGDGVPGSGATASMSAGGLFEVLLRSLDRAPERLDYLHGLMTELRSNVQEPDLFPVGFDEIWLPIWRARQRQKGEEAR